MSCARCARLRSWLAKCNRCRARFQARNERNEIPVSSLNRCRKREADNPASAALLAAVTGSPENRVICAIDEDLAFASRQAPGPFIEYACANAFRLDHDADRGAMVARDGVPDIGRHRNQLAVSLGAVGHREPQAALERDIDMKSAGATFARPAEQAGVKDTLR